MQYNNAPPQAFMPGLSYGGPTLDADLAASLAGMGLGAASFGPSLGQAQMAPYGAGQSGQQPVAGINGGSETTNGNGRGSHRQYSGDDGSFAAEMLSPTRGSFGNGYPSPSNPNLRAQAFAPSFDGVEPTQTYAGQPARNQQPNPSAPPFISSYGMNHISPPAGDAGFLNGYNQPIPSPQTYRAGGRAGGTRPASMMDLNGSREYGVGGGAVGGSFEGRFGGWPDSTDANGGLSPVTAQHMHNFAGQNPPGPSPRRSHFNTKRASHDFRSPTSSFSPSTARSSGIPSSNPSYPPTPQDFAQTQYDEARQPYRLENTAEEIANGLRAHEDAYGMPGPARMTKLDSSNSLSSLGSGHSISSMAAGRMIGDLLDDPIIPTALVIKNIPFSCERVSLLAIMESLGAPLPYAFNYHLDGGTFRGLAFANFRHPHEAESVLLALNGYDISGRKLRVEYKKVLQAGEKERIERDKAVKRMKSLNFDRDGQVSSEGGRDRMLPQRRRPQQDNDLAAPRHAANGNYQGGGGRSMSNRWTGEGGERTRNLGNRGSAPPVPPLPLLPPLPLTNPMTTLQAVQTLQSLGQFNASNLAMGMGGQPLHDLAAYPSSPGFNPMMSPGGGLLSPHTQSDLSSPLLQMPLGSLPFPLSLANLNQHVGNPGAPVGILPPTQGGAAIDASRRGQNIARSLTPGSASESQDPLNGNPRRGSYQPSSRSSASNAPSASLSLDLNDPKVLDIYSRILLFKEDRMRDELAFSRSLSIKERRLVHMVAQKLGLHHYSAGEGHERYAVVTRMAPGGHQQRPSRTEQTFGDLSSKPYPYGGGRDHDSDSAPSPQLRIKKSMPNMNYLNGPAVTPSASRLQPQRSSGNLRNYTTISNGSSGSSAGTGTLKRTGGGEGGSASQMFNNLFGSSLTSPVTADMGADMYAAQSSAPYGSNGLLSPGVGNGFSQQPGRVSPTDSGAPASPGGRTPISGVLRQPRGPSGESKGFTQRVSMRGSATGLPLNEQMELHNGSAGYVSQTGSNQGRYRGKSDGSSLNTSGSSVIEEGDEGADDRHSNGLSS